MCNSKVALSELKLNPNVLVKGGWFKNTNIVKVSSATIFGSSVNESDLWEELDQVGTLTRVVFEIDADPRPFSLTINEEANFILYES